MTVLSKRLRRRAEHVADAADRVEQRHGAAPAADLAPEVTYVDVDDVTLGLAVAAPHVLGDHLPRQNLSGVAQEILEEGVLARGQCDMSPRAGHVVSGGVEG